MKTYTFTMDGMTFSMTDEEERKIRKRRIKYYLDSHKDSTEEEREELKKWIKSGGDPYDNPNMLYGSDGWPMDFIEAMRFDREMIAQLQAEERINT